MNINKRNKYSTKIKDNEKTNIKISNTLDNRHRNMINYFNDIKLEKVKLEEELENIINEINEINLNSNISDEDLIYKNNLLDEKIKIEYQLDKINTNYNEMDYYDNVGDLITNYYELRQSDSIYDTQEYSLVDFFNKKKEVVLSYKNNKAKLFENYCQRVDGIRINSDDGSNRIIYCNECKIEKILDTTESAYICSWCGDAENIILDEERQIKNYSPYQRINHFKEWLNQFQSKQSPDIPEQVFKDLMKLLNQKRVSDLSKLKVNDIKYYLKKLGYNKYYEHTLYIINKLNNLPPLKITNDMEKIFIKMFQDIQEPWQLYKPQNRINFLSYSYVLHKFCELLNLNHLLEFFPLYKDQNKIRENDQIWKKICNYLDWEFKSSIK
jgi:hypothetical protein